VKKKTSDRQLARPRPPRASHRGSLRVVSGSTAWDQTPREPRVPAATPNVKSPAGACGGARLPGHGEVWCSHPVRAKGMYDGYGYDFMNVMSKSCRSSFPTVRFPLSRWLPPGFPQDDNGRLSWAPQLNRGALFFPPMPGHLHDRHVTRRFPHWRSRPSTQISREGPRISRASARL
jgi:hypothetical protein